MKYQVQENCRNQSNQPCTDGITCHNGQHTPDTGI